MLTREEALLLEALVKMAKNSPVLECELEDVLARVRELAGANAGLEERDVERLLVSLWEKGYIRILRAPPSASFVHEYILKQHERLNRDLLLKRVSPQEYVSRLKELAQVQQGVELAPLPLVEPIELIRSIKKTLSPYTVDCSGKPSTGEKLAAELEHEIGLQLSLLRALITALSNLALEVKAKLEEASKRAGDNKASVAAHRKSVEELEQQLETLKSYLTGGFEEDTVRELEQKLEQMRREYEILRARILIEERQDLETRRSELERSIRDLERRLEELRTAKTNLVGECFSLVDMLRCLAQVYPRGEALVSEASAVCGQAKVFSQALEEAMKLASSLQ